jgi:DNA invertase Pin-like site-specific DNA recombinase
VKSKARCAAIYVRVSTGSQTVENQLRELRRWPARLADRRGVQRQSVSGGKGRDQRPGLDKLLQAVARREVDMVLAWSVDRLGRSLRDLLKSKLKSKSKPKSKPVTIVSLH